MDKYLVECEEKPCSDFGTSDYHFKNAQVARLWPNQDVFTTGQLLAMKCKAESDGQKEAWELAQKILRRPECGGYTVDELRQACDITGVVPDRDVPGVCIIKDAFATVLSGIKEMELRKNKQLAPGDLVRVHSGNVGDNVVYDGRLALVVAIRESKHEGKLCPLLKVVFDDGDVSLYSRDAVDYIRTVGFDKFFSEEEEEEE